MKYPIFSKHNRLLALILSLILVAGFAGCSGDDASADEILICTVSVESLDVHKKCDTDSRILGQLPMDLEIEILEQTTVDEIDWGRIDKTTLPDGTKVKGGWIDLQCVRFPGDPDADATEPAPDTQEETNPVTVNMGTVTAGKLNIRKGPDSKYETDGAYYNGDRIEILETQTIDDTVWGRTNLGWVGMGYVRMDGSPVAANDQEKNPTAARVTSDGNTTVLGYGVVNLGELNVRLGPGTDYGKVSTIAKGIRYAYYQQTDGWVRMEDGWVSTDYFYIEGTTTDGAITGTVTTDDLNIRTGPNTSFQNTATYKKGETIEILAQVGSWGYTEKGWIFMTYVEPNEPTYSTGTGTIANGLNIRKEPNADSEIVGTYTKGDSVTITEVQGTWGKTDTGWINLKYVDYQ